MKTEMALFAVARIDFQARFAGTGDLPARYSNWILLQYKDATGKLFLVTNKHVVYDKGKHYFPDRLP